MLDKTQPRSRRSYWPVSRLVSNFRTDQHETRSSSVSTKLRASRIVQALFFVAASSCVAACAGTSKSNVSEQPWVSLFNGEDLTGWQVKFAGHPLGVNYKNTFRVENGYLSVNYDEYETFEGEFGHLFTEQTYSHYLLRLEYRMLGEQTPGGPVWALRNNGIMLHSQSPASMELEQLFPRSIEVQLLNGTEKEDRFNGNVCTPGTHIVIQGELQTQHCIDSRSRTNFGNAWVSVEIEVRGDEYILQKINGVPTMQYSHPQIDLNDPGFPTIGLIDRAVIEQGHIAIQAESHPTQFRKIEILILDQ